MARKLFASSATLSCLAVASAPFLLSAAPVAGESSQDDTKSETVAGISTEGLRDRDIKRLKNYLDGREAGEARQCIRLRQVRRSANLGDDILVYEMRGGDILVNRPQSGCSNLSGNGVINDSPDDFVCSGQIFEVRDFQAGITLDSCSFGEFVEYVETEQDAAD